MPYSSIMQEEYATRRELVIACLSGDTRHVKVKLRRNAPKALSSPSPSPSPVPLVLPTDLAKLVQSYVGDYDDTGISHVRSMNMVHLQRPTRTGFYGRGRVDAQPSTPHSDGFLWEREG